MGKEERIQKRVNRYAYAIAMNMIYKDPKTIEDLCGLWHYNAIHNVVGTFFKNKQEFRNFATPDRLRKAELSLEPKFREYYLKVSSRFTPEEYDWVNRHCYDEVNRMRELMGVRERMVYTPISSDSKEVTQESSYMTITSEKFEDYDKLLELVLLHVRSQIVEQISDPNLKEYFKSLENKVLTEKIQARIKMPKNKKEPKDFFDFRLRIFTQIIDTISAEDSTETDVDTIVYPQSVSIEIIPSMLYCEPPITLEKTIHIELDLTNFYTDEVRKSLEKLREPPVTSFGSGTSESIYFTYKMGVANIFDKIKPIRGEKPSQKTAGDRLTVQKQLYITALSANPLSQGKFSVPTLESLWDGFSASVLPVINYMKQKSELYSITTEGLVVSLLGFIQRIIFAKVDTTKTSKAKQIEALNELKSWSCRFLKSILGKNAPNKPVAIRYLNYSILLMRKYNKFMDDMQEKSRYELVRKEPVKLDTVKLVTLRKQLSFTPKKGEPTPFIADQFNRDFGQLLAEILGDAEIAMVDHPSVDNLETCMNEIIKIEEQLETDLTYSELEGESDPKIIISSLLKSIEHETLRPQSNFHDGVRNAAIKCACSAILDIVGDTHVKRKVFDETVKFGHYIQDFERELIDITIVRPVSQNNFQFKDTSIETVKNTILDIKQQFKDHLAKPDKKKAADPKVLFSSNRERFLSMKAVYSRIFSELRTLQTVLKKSTLDIGDKTKELQIQAIIKNIRDLQRFDRGILGLNVAQMSMDDSEIERFMINLDECINTIDAAIKENPTVSNSIQKLRNLKTMVNQIGESNLANTIERRNARYILNYLEVCLKLMNNKIPEAEAIKQALNPPKVNAILRGTEGPEVDGSKISTEPINPATSSFEDIVKYPYYLCNTPGQADNIERTFNLTPPQNMDILRSTLVNNTKDLQAMINARLDEIVKNYGKPEEQLKQLIAEQSKKLSDKQLKKLTEEQLKKIKTDEDILDTKFIKSAKNVYPSLKRIQIEILLAFKVFDHLPKVEVFTIGEGEDAQEYVMQDVIFKEKIKDAKKILRSYLKQYEAKAESENEDDSDNEIGTMLRSSDIGLEENESIDAETVVKYFNRYRAGDKMLKYNGCIYDYLVKENSHRMQLHMFVPDLPDDPNMRPNPIRFAALCKVYSMDYKKGVKIKGDFPVIVSQFSLPHQSKNSILLRLKKEVEDLGICVNKTESYHYVEKAIDKEGAGKHYLMYIYDGANNYGNGIAPKIITTGDARKLLEIYDYDAIRLAFPDMEGTERRIRKESDFTAEQIQERLDHVKKVILEEYYSEYRKNHPSFLNPTPAKIKDWKGEMKRFDPTGVDIEGEGLQLFDPTGLITDFPIISKLFGSFHVNTHQYIEKSSNPDVSEKERKDNEKIAISRKYYLFKCMEYLLRPQQKTRVWKSSDEDEDSIRFISYPSVMLEENGDIISLMRFKMPKQFAKDQQELLQLNLGFDPGVRSALTVGMYTMFPIAEPYQDTFEADDTHFSDLLEKRGLSPELLEHFLKILGYENKVNATVADLHACIQRKERAGRSLQSSIYRGIGSERGFFDKNTGKPTIGKTRTLVRKMRNLDSVNEKVRGVHDTVSKILYSGVKTMITHADTEIRSALNIAESQPIKVRMEDNRSLSSPKFSRRLNKDISDWERGASRKLIENYCTSQKNVRFLKIPSWYSSSRCSNCGCAVEKGYIEFNQDANLLIFVPKASGDAVRCINDACVFSKKFGSFLEQLNGICLKSFKPDRLDLEKMLEICLLQKGSNTSAQFNQFIVGLMLFNRDRNAAFNFARANGFDIYQYKRIIRVLRKMGKQNPADIIAGVSELEDLGDINAKEIDLTVEQIGTKYAEWVESIRKKGGSAHNIERIRNEGAYLKSRVEELSNYTLAREPIPAARQEWVKGIFASPESLFIEARKALKGRGKPPPIASVMISGDASGPPTDHPPPS
jgi:hypothetical protein